MTRRGSAQNPAPPPPGNDDVRDRGRALALFALTTPLQWFLTLIATLLLGFAGVWLVVAWHIGPETAWRKHEYARYTAEARGVIRESWVAIDLDPAKIRRADQWRSIARAVPCEIVEIQADWSAARQRAFCGTVTRFPLAYDVAGLRDLAPGVPFAWSRDARDIAMPELRMSVALHDWLSTHAPNRFMHADWPATTSLDWLRLELDQPVDAIVAGWISGDRTVPMLYDPARPGDALPAGVVRARLAARPAIVVPLILASIGVGIWMLGMRVLPAMANFNGIGRAILTVLPLLALPWWADHLPQGLRAFNGQVSEVIGDMIGDIDPLDRLVAGAPEDALLAHGKRMVWRVEESHYGDTLGMLDIAAPRPAPIGEDAALAALAAQVTAQVRGMNARNRTAFFAALRGDKQMDLTAVGVVALPAARMAAESDEADTRSAARSFLTAWTTSPTVSADRNRLAFRARTELLATARVAPP
jgi:hypothetical protein